MLCIDDYFAMSKAVLLLGLLIIVICFIQKKINRDKTFNMALEHTANGEYELAYSEFMSVSDSIDTTKEIIRKYLISLG